MRFSERKGFVKVRNLVQVEGMDEALRNGLWNAIHSNFFGHHGYLDYQMSMFYSRVPGNFFETLWRSYFKQPIDAAPDVSQDFIEVIRRYFFQAKWYEVYDFIEFVLNWSQDLPNLVNDLNLALEADLSGYRIVQNKVVEIADTAELDSIDEAISQNEFAAASKHLQRAVELLFDRRNPDVRNSIKESISAVESAAKVLTNNPKATLGDALKRIEKHAPVHSAMKEAFSKLYGYTSDAGGIRHAMMTDSSVTKEDARFLLISCSAFINYLKAKK